MRREITLTHALGWLIALVASVVALAWAFLLYIRDSEGRSALFATGGLALAVWAASHLTSGARRD